MAKQSKTVDEFQSGGKNYTIIRPNSKINEDAGMEYNRTLSKVLKNEGLLREALGKYMTEQGVWDDSKETQHRSLLIELNEAEKKLSKGGIKLSEARELAINMKAIRWQLNILTAEKNQLDVNSAQGQAEQARFNYMMVNCLLDEQGEQVFSSVHEYLDNTNEDLSEVANQAAERFGNLYWGLDSEYEKKLPENEFLTHWNFVDESLNLIDKQGRRINLEGDLIDEEGRLVDEEGNLIDSEGNPLSEDGVSYSFDTKPFLDDDGNEITSPSATTEEKPAKTKKVETKSKRGRPAKKKTEAEAVKAEA